MEFTGERYIPEKEGWLALQHYHRYYFVTYQIDLKDKVVLDIACGEGYGCEILSRLSEHVYGVDISYETIDHAKSKYPKPNITFLQGDSTSIPVETNSIDIVTSFETIEHHDKHDEMLLEIKRVLKHDGILVISSPNKGYYEKNMPGQANDFHVKELYFEEFKDLLSKYFIYNKLYFQNNVLGSIIANEYENLNYSRPVFIEKDDGKITEIESRINICISSDNKIIFPASISFCTPPASYDVFSIIDNQKVTIQKQGNTLEKINNSLSLMIGKLITLPFRIVKNLIR